MIKNDSIKRKKLGKTYLFFIKEVSFLIISSHDPAVGIFQLRIFLPREKNKKNIDKNRTEKDWLKTERY